MARGNQRQRWPEKAIRLDRASFSSGATFAGEKARVMRVALINPQWSFDHSIYFGCRAPHLPLEYGCAKTLLQAAGHEAEIIDGQMFDLTHAEIAQAANEFRPDMTVVTTAPSYLFWRCAPPELRVPQEMFRALEAIGGTKVVIGPHASTTPRAALRKL